MIIVPEVVDRTGEPRSSVAGRCSRDARKARAGAESGHRLCAVHRRHPALPVRAPDRLPCLRQAAAGVVSELNHEIDSSEAASAGATFIDPIPWLCDNTTCPPVLGEYLVYDFLSLLTTPFSASLAAELDVALPALGEAN